MWRAFCRHVIDIVNDYFDKDGLLEENMEIEVGGSADDDDDNDSLVDDEDRRIID